MQSFKQILVHCRRSELVLVVRFVLIAALTPHSLWHGSTVQNKPQMCVKGQKISEDKNRVIILRVRGGDEPMPIPYYVASDRRMLQNGLSLCSDLNGRLVQGGVLGP